MIATLTPVFLENSALAGGSSTGGAILLPTNHAATTSAAVSSFGGVTVLLSVAASFKVTAIVLVPLLASSARKLWSLVLVLDQIA